MKLACNYILNMLLHLYLHICLGYMYLKQNGETTMEERPDEEEID